VVLKYADIAGQVAHGAGRLRARAAITGPVWRDNPNATRRQLLIDAADSEVQPAARRAVEVHRNWSVGRPHIGIREHSAIRECQCSVAHLG
jgi:hypothetical protein